MRGADKPASDRYDLATLIYLIDSRSEDMVRVYNPVIDVRAASYLSSHLAGALAKVIILVEVNGFGGEVLDAYVARRVMAARRAQEAAQKAEEPGVGGGGADQEDGAAQDDLEAFVRRLEDAMGDATQKSFARRLGVSIPTLTKILAHKPVRASTREQIAERLGW